MNIEFPLPLITGFLMVLFRAAGLFLFLPLPGLSNAPEFLRIALAVSTASALWARGIDSRILYPTIQEAQMSTFILLVSSEAVWGAFLGLLVKMIEESALLAAQQLGFQAGFSYASTVDPSSNADSTVLETLMSLLCMYLFFALGIHRLLIAGLFEGHNPLIESWSQSKGLLIESLSQALSGAFKNGLAFALPLVAAMAAVDVLAGLLGRLLPGAQTALLTTPLKIQFALAGMALALPVIVTRYRISAETSVGLWQELMRLPAR